MKIWWKMKHLLQKSKCSLFHNIFKYMIFQRRQKALLWSNGLKHDKWFENWLPIFLYFSPNISLLFIHYFFTFHPIFLYFSSNIFFTFFPIFLYFSSNISLLFIQYFFTFHPIFLLFIHYFFTFHPIFLYFSSNISLLFIDVEEQKLLTHFTLEIPVTQDMAPNAKVLVYYIRDDFEVVATSIKFDIESCFRNPVRQFSKFS